MIENELSQQKILSVHFWLDGNSHKMNAFIQNRCEYEYLFLIKTISTALGVEAIVDTQPLEEGGLIRWFIITLKKENKSATITAFLLGSIISAVVVTPLNKTAEKLIEKAFEDKELTELQKEKYRLEIENLKQGQIDVLNGNAVKKRKSNFYEALAKEKAVNQVSYSICDSDTKEICHEVFVKREDFAKFLMATDELKPEFDENAVIEIISPVLKKGKYKWVGLYNGEPIHFSMKSAEFKQEIQSGHIEFKNGSTIKCLLRINRKIDNEGMEIITGYEALRIDSRSENGVTTETSEGKKYRRQRKERMAQVNLFENEER